MIDEVWKLVRDIEAGSVTLSFQKSPDEIWAGNVEYKSSNGWTVVVFDDCGEWDYFDSFVAPDGRSLEFDDMPDDLRFYSPSEQVAKERYGF